MAIMSKGITLAYKRFDSTASLYKHSILATNCCLVDESGQKTGDYFNATFTGVTAQSTPYNNVYTMYNNIGYEMTVEYAGKTYKVFGDGVHQGNEFCCEAINNAGEIIHIAMGINDINPPVYVDIVTPEGNFKVLKNLQEIPELGNNAREKVDVTTLADDDKQYEDGLGDTAQDLPFKFLYDRAQFNELNALEGAKEWRVTLPDGETAIFTASPSVKTAGVGVSNPLTYTLTLSVKSKIDFE